MTLKRIQGKRHIATLHATVYESLATTSKQNHKMLLPGIKFLMTTKCAMRA